MPGDGPGRIIGVLYPTNTGITTNGASFTSLLVDFFLQIVSKIYTLLKFDI